MSETSTLRPVMRTDSLAEQAYWELRSSIADGTLEPGAALTERQLAASLGVSPTPVREALRKLEHEGLVVRTDNRRLRVAEKPDETVDELRQVEVALRALEARFAAGKLDPARIARMHEIVAAAEAGVDTLPSLDLLALAHAFDREIAEAAANPSLRRMIESFTLVGGDDRDRLDVALVETPAWRALRLQQHRDLLAALERGDGLEAEGIVRRNARSSLRRLSPDGQSDPAASDVDAP